MAAQVQAVDLAAAVVDRLMDHTQAGLERRAKALLVELLSMTMELHLSMREAAAAVLELLETTGPTGRLMVPEATEALVNPQI